MTVIRKSSIVPGTLEAIARICGWAFNVMLTGIQPATDEHGKTLPSQGEEFLADGWRGVLTSIRGDWDFSTPSSACPTGEVLAAFVGYAKQSGTTTMRCAIPDRTRELDGDDFG